MSERPDAPRLGTDPALAAAPGAGAAGPGGDRRSTARARVGGGVVTLRCRGAGVEPPFAAVTSASVVTLTAAGLLLLADLPRGVDIPGGHVQFGERTAEQTARREVWEEVRARLGPLTLVEVIESDYFGGDDLTYMMIFVGRVVRLAPWEGGFESAGRVELPAAVFLDRYRGGDPALMRHLVTCALTVAGPGTTGG
ncbi:NUDIX domain-containing protein [Parafrankia elaeagni]|uniref:NUDIX domain-containing protein n=1 Tax=Parafrankia elaeagni TaxID=222534 RepID=UPI00035E5047|nr:NUDIX domain-containing protein [Parafrankia elaeagni]